MSTPNQRITKLEYIVGFILLNIILMFYVFSWVQARMAVSNNSKNQFYNQSSFITQLIDNRLHELQEATKNGERFFNNDEEIGRNEFVGFFGGDEEDERYSGIEGIVFIEKVKDSDRTAFIQKVRSDKSTSRYGYPFFNIQTPEVKQEYMVVNYIQPFEENKSLFGYDVSADPVLNSYLTEAVNSKRVITTPRVQFLNKEVILVILPVYPANDSVNVKGFLVTLIRPDVMFDGFLMSDFKQKMGFAVYDGDLEEKVIHQHTPIYEDSNNLTDHLSVKQLVHQQKVTFGSRPWTLHFYTDMSSTKNLEDALPNIFFFGGSILTLFMFVLLSEAIASGSVPEKKV